MDRRKDPRRRRRLVVRYWRQGEENPRPGHTLNISSGGAYIGTHRPPRSGSRVRVEVMDGDTFVFEGVVTHSHRIPPELERLKPSGMGVRFLSHEELLAGTDGRMAPVGDDAGAGGDRPEGAAKAPAGVGAEATAEPVAAAPPTPAPLSPPPPVLSPAADPPDAPRRTGRRLLATDTVVTIRFRDRAQLGAILNRDLVHGGLFIATRRPAAMDEIVALRLYAPGRQEPVEAPARVVHRVAPGSADGRAGMGVELVDPEDTLAELAEILAELD